jgi:2-haloacid dehalogenase
LNIEPDQILHTAQSLHHDHVPATGFGLARAWIDRQNLANSDNWGATARVENRPEMDFRFSTLMEMAEEVVG